MKIKYCFVLIFSYLCVSIAYSQYAGSGDYQNNIFTGCPTIYLPSGNNVSTLPFADWADVPGATHYHMQMSLFSNFMLPDVDVKLTKSEYQVTVPLEPLRIYYYRVQSADSSKYQGFICSYIYFFTGGKHD
jgi:hypothetical protein